MRVLIVAPHHDDEVFGPGATIPKYARQGHEVHVLVMATGDDLFRPGSDQTHQGRVV